MEPDEKVCLVLHVRWPWRRNKPFRVFHWHWPRADIVNCEAAKEEPADV